MFLCSDLANLATIFLYFTASLLFFTAILTKDTHFWFWAASATIFGFILHSVLLVCFFSINAYPSVLENQILFSLAAWMALLFCSFVYWKWRPAFLPMIVLPLALILFLSSATGTFYVCPTLTILSDLWFSLYIGALFFSLNIIVLSAISGLLYLYIEKKIKNKSKISRFSKELPSLAGFDHFNHLCTFTGFPLCTLGVLSGFIWAFFSSQQAFVWQPKEISMLVVWIFYAYLFYRRVFSGWKGKKPAQLASLLFLLTILSLFIVNFLASS